MSKPQWSLRTHSALQTERIGYFTGQVSRGGEVLSISGDLGTGKTCFVRGLAGGIGASTIAVSSPTFVFIHEYSGHLRLAHADLFRLDSPSASQDLGLADYLDEGTVLAIEWPEKAAHELPRDRLDIEMKHRGKTVRQLHFYARGEISLELLARLRRLVNQRTQHEGIADTRSRHRTEGTSVRKP